MKTHTLVLLHPKIRKPAYAFNTPYGLGVSVDSAPPAMTEEEAEETADMVIRLMEGVIAIVKPIPTRESV